MHTTSGPEARQTSQRRRGLVSLLAMLPLMEGALGAEPGLAAGAQEPAPSHLLRLVTEPHARAVGEVLGPELSHKTRAQLVQALTRRLSMFSNKELHESCDIEELQAAFQQSVRADFGQGRCLSVSGWVLTRTEAELCALAALSARAA